MSFCIVTSVMHQYAGFFNSSTGTSPVVLDVCEKCDFPTSHLACCEKSVHSIQDHAKLL